MDVVSTGEVHWLNAYVNQDRSVYDPIHPLVCSCGQTVSECEFWQQVAKRLGRPLDDVKLRLRFFDGKRFGENHHNLSEKFKRRMKSAICSYPAMYRNAVIQNLYKGVSVAEDCIQLYDAIEKVSGASCIIDSSKTAFRFRSVYEQRPDTTKAILLARDYRAVVFSKMNRDKDLEASAYGWRKKVQQMEELTKDLNQSHVFRLKYELLCSDPKNQLQRMCEFLELEYSDDMLTRPECGTHHLGGSPSKFDASKSEIKLDQKYKGEFSEGELQKMARLVGDAAQLWGYD